MSLEIETIIRDAYPPGLEGMRRSEIRDVLATHGIVEGRDYKGGLTKIQLLGIAVGKAIDGISPEKPIEDPNVAKMKEMASVMETLVMSSNPMQLRKLCAERKIPTENTDTKEELLAKLGFQNGDSA